jgi:hypothetical protein
LLFFIVIIFVGMAATGHAACIGSHAATTPTTNNGGAVVGSNAGAGSDIPLIN